MWMHAMSESPASVARRASSRSTTVVIRRALVAFLALGASIPARGELQILLQQSGYEPGDVAEDTLQLDVGPCATVTFDVYVRHTTTSPPIREIRVVLPCQIANGDSGTLDFVRPISRNTQRSDYILHDRRCAAGPRYGLTCNVDDDCQAGANSCRLLPQSGQPVISDDSCGASDSSESQDPQMVFRFNTLYPRFDSTPAYLGTFQYRAAADVAGAFTLEIGESSGTTILEGDGSAIGYFAPGAVVTALAGECDFVLAQCCLPYFCARVDTEHLCSSLGGSWYEPISCEEPCSCTHNSQCGRNNHCNVGRCVNERCVVTPTGPGDLDGLGPPHATLDDVLCAIRAMTDFQSCPEADLYPWCDGDRVVDATDLEALARVFGGLDPCGCTGEPLAPTTRLYLHDPSDAGGIAHLDPVTVELDGGDSFTLWAIVEYMPPLTVQLLVTFQCSATDGTAGEVALVPPPRVNNSNSAYIFRGGYNAVHIYPGHCPADPPPADGNAWAQVTRATWSTPPALHGTRYYVAEATYSVSADAAGDFHIDLANEPFCQIVERRPDIYAPVPFTTTGATIRIRTGRCCISRVCTEGLTRYQCESQEGDWAAGLLCDDGCP